MQQPTRLISTPFAQEGDKTEIQNVTGEFDNSATYRLGFPPLTMQSIRLGGKPPKGTDFNGVLFDITENISFLCKGGRYQYNAGLSTLIGGYPEGSNLLLDDNVTEVVSTVAGNQNNPNTDMTGWILKPNRTTVEYVLDASGKTQQQINDMHLKSVEEFGVSFSSTFDQSVAMQAALDSGFNLFFPKSGTIYANNLVQSTHNQVLYGFGNVVIQKNGNGAILTSSANYPQLHNLKFRGGSSNTPEFAGDNLVFNGVNPKLINCGSMWAAGRALKATGNAVVIRGSQDIWQTSDTTATGYDIEIGTSGVCTLYHQLDGIYTSQKTGGILLVDTGSHSLKGGQIGKLNIKAGTKPSGVNGGMTMGCRILGDVNIEQSNTGFSNNQFSDITLTFAAGTSFCIVDASNNYSSGFASVNNGNGANNIVIRSTGTGADGFAYMTYGAGTTTRSLGMNFSDATRAWKFDGSVILPNNQSLKMLDNTGTERIIAILAANNNLTLGANTGGYTYIQGTNLGLNSASGTQVRVSDGFIAPFTDNAKTCGTPSLKWSKSYTIDAHFFPLGSLNPTVNGEMIFEKTSDTQLKIKVQGSDGVVRSATLTLA